MNLMTLEKIPLGVAAMVIAAAACSTADIPTNIGTARVRIDVAGVSSFDITRVTVRANGGFDSDLVRDDATGAFTGTMMLPAGPRDIVGQGFVDDELVGESIPVPVDVQAGFVVGANIRILDLTGAGTTGYSPIIVALSHPLSTTANQPTPLSITAIDPNGDAVSYQWSTDCADAQFTDPASNETQWIKADQGTCNIAVTASDDELSVTETFKVVVFGENANIGAVNVDAVFVPTPTVSLNLSYTDDFCSVFSGAADGSCRVSIASPDQATVSVFVEWGIAELGSIELTDNCGGTFEESFKEPFILDGTWTPPVDESLCLITARAISPESLNSEVSAALFVRDGQAPPPPEAPQMSGIFNYFPYGPCEFQANETDVQCPDYQVSEVGVLDVQIDWGNQEPGTVELIDCGGEFLVLDDQDPFSLHAEWQALSRDSCEFQLIARDPAGVATATTKLHFDVI